jgi:hypothetical protein
MYVVTAVVLLNKSDMAIGVPVTVDGECAVLVTAATLDTPVEDVQVIDGHGVLCAILVVLASPLLVGAGHEEGAAELFEGPNSRNFLTV